MAMDGSLAPDVPAGALGDPMARAVARDRQELEQSIGYRFRDPALLDEALTHATAAKAKGRANYQRLEFLGDRVLGLVVAEMLFEAYPDAKEGELSKRLSDLVRRETCAEVARDWGLAGYIRLGVGEASAGVRERGPILADVCEALIGAVFLDGGFTAARTLVRKAFEDRMRARHRPSQDAKTALQEWAQARGLSTPVYKTQERSGPDHAPRFTIRVEVDGFPAISAGAGSKRAAEQGAAEAFLVREGVLSGAAT
jgi:ribonuclease-3